MKTDDLIVLLGTNVGPVPRRRVGWILGGAIAVFATAAAAMVFALGVRPHLGGTSVWTALLLKLGFTIGILIPASIYLIRLARPGGEWNTPIALVALPFAVVTLVAAVNFVFAPVSHWDDMVAGRGWHECLLSIPIIAVVPFTVIVLAVHQMAPTNLVRTGAFARTGRRQYQRDRLCISLRGRFDAFRGALIRRHDRAVHVGRGKAWTAPW